MKSLLKPLSLLLALGLPLSAQAHKSWFLPSSTVLSEVGHYVTVDAAVSNDLFYFDHNPVRLDSLAIIAPDGSRLTPENVATGHYRSTFDVPLPQVGTYKIVNASSGMFASWKDDSRQTKRWRGSAEAFKKEVPAKARDLQVTLADNRLETFVTVGKPSSEVLAPTGSGLELVPVTHPNDLVAGETASFKLLLDGQPAAGLKVSVVPGGTRYRDQQDEITVTTGADGAFAITWPQAGMYWLNAAIGGGRMGGPGGEPGEDAPPAAKAPKAKKKGGDEPLPRRASYTATLEVLP
ncbi:DUF4198 domain-containing protein [Solimonas variicoloris]|uniref:DUF4198 domain-containing protein n=1 Tax=Solimonas variicoloris TaxID=254408 RepID=UPI0003A142A0|nr:DUF4198 domain-containing protein [Solimonas variicoloris]